MTDHRAAIAQPVSRNSCCSAPQLSPHCAMVHHLCNSHMLAHRNPLSACQAQRAAPRAARRCSWCTGLSTACRHAGIGLAHPPALAWFRAEFTTAALALTMLAMGTSLTFQVHAPKVYSHWFFPSPITFVGSHLQSEGGQKHRSGRGAVLRCCKDSDADPVVGGTLAPSVVAAAQDSRRVLQGSGREETVHKYRMQQLSP